MSFLDLFSKFPSPSCCIFVFVLYLKYTVIAVNNMDKYTVLWTDEVVYLCSFPKPNAFLLILKKSSILTY